MTQSRDHRNLIMFYALEINGQIYFYSKNTEIHQSFYYILFNCQHFHTSRIDIQEWQNHVLTWTLEKLTADVDEPTASSSLSDS